MMNDSLLQVYNCQSDSLSITSPFHDSSDLTNSSSKDVLLRGGSNGPVTSEENRDSPPPATYEANNPHTLPAGIIISEDLQTKTSSHEGNLEEAVEEKEVTVTTGEEAVRTHPAVNSIGPDVQELQLPGDIRPKDPSFLSASVSSPLLPFSSESEPPPLQQQQPSHVGKRVTFAPKVTEYSDNGRREKVERNLVNLSYFLRLFLVGEECCVHPGLCLFPVSDEVSFLSCQTQTWCRGRGDRRQSEPETQAQTTKDKGGRPIVRQGCSRCLCKKKLFDSETQHWYSHVICTCRLDHGSSVGFRFV